MPYDLAVYCPFPCVTVVALFFSNVTVTGLPALANSIVRLP